MIWLSGWVLSLLLLSIPSQVEAFSHFVRGTRTFALTQLNLGGSNNIGESKTNKDQPLVTSRRPHHLSNGRGTFLGFREAKDIPGLKSSANPIVPDGGLSPCVIRVLGVGGGGCNAVRLFL